MTKRVRVAPPWVRGDKKHGSPRDRGSADRYYGRPYNPHWHFYGASSFWSELGCELIESDQMTAEEIAEYDNGYNGETGEKVWFEPEPQMEDY
jgi:hypothetical protein